MKASKRGGSGGSASCPCFRQQLLSQRLTVTGAKLIQHHTSNCYPSSSFKTPPLPLLLSPASPACLYFLLTRKTGGGTSTGSADQCFSFCLKFLFFLYPTRYWMDVDIKLGHGNICVLYCFLDVMRKKGEGPERQKVDAMKKMYTRYTRWCRIKRVHVVLSVRSMGVTAKGGTCLGWRMTASETKTSMLVCLLWCFLHGNSFLKYFSWHCASVSLSSNYSNLSFFLLK